MLLATLLTNPSFIPAPPPPSPLPRCLLVFKDSTVQLNPDSLQRFMVAALKEMQKNEDAWPFLAPVNAEEVSLAAKLPTC